MKTLSSLSLATFIAVISYFNSPAQSIWLKKQDFPSQASPRRNSVSFSINGMGYVGTGESPSGPVLNDFWRYNPTTNSWTQVANFVGQKRHSATSFVLNNKAYVGTGQIPGPSIYTNDFYEYDPNSNSWRQIASVGPNGRYGSVCFVISNKGYITAGYASDFGKDNSTWEYNPSTNTWVAKKAFPFTPGVKYSASFVINNRAYVAGGLTDNPSLGAVNINFEYNAINDAWIARATIPNNNFRYSAASLTLFNSGYLIGGTIPLTALYSNVLRYNQLTNSWTILSETIPNGALSGAASFVICNKGYVGPGERVNQTYLRDFYEFNPPSDLFVNGPSTLCNTNTYNVPNLPAGTSVVWSSSNPNGVSINSSGVASVVNNFNGQISIIATISGPCNPIALSKVIWVGKPKINSITGPDEIVYGQAGLFINTSSGGTSYSWLTPAGWTVQSPNNFSTWITVGGTLSGTHNVYATTSNTCGSTTGYIPVTVIPSGGCLATLSLSPNPATSEVVVSAAPPPCLTTTEVEESESVATLSLSNAEHSNLQNASVVVTDNMGAIHRQATVVGPEFTIDLNGLRPGIYIVKYTSIGYTTEARLVKR
ncbi:MAG TPA: kelch repeat-containing protein [Cyclobacteriaceae bacterium]|nr:kelch repeat-containing protein [Cyclobacteriaceae bacterium]